MLSRGRYYVPVSAFKSDAELKKLAPIDGTKGAAHLGRFEEGVPIYCHPKDPYKRIDILQSTRSIKVGIDGVTLAETSNSLFLLETTLRTRYYLPPTSVNWEYLVPSNTASLCPYKGRAEYYHAKVDDQLYENVVWYYRYPTPESALVAGYLCFYNELVDIWVDGEKEDRNR
jgi:uncharacterized protein (DUF427 family)